MKKGERGGGGGGWGGLCGLFQRSIQSHVGLGIIRQRKDCNEIDANGPKIKKQKQKKKHADISKDRRKMKQIK